MDENDIFKDFTPEKWQFNTMPVFEHEEFIGVPGPTHHLPPGSSPFDFFCLFIPTYFWALWASYTNAKANMEYGNSKGTPRKWHAVTGAELKAWVASVMLWSTWKTISFQNFHAGTMDPNKVQRWFPSFTRWEQIKRFFKLSHPEHEDPTDKLTKVRGLWEYFLAACKANLWPGENVAVDEAMKKFKGRCSFKQYIKNKPVRWGLKIFCLCCSATAYLWNAIIYVGKKKTDDQKKKEMGATTATVLDLVGPLANKNHCVFMDNFYTSIPLFVELRKRGFSATGTVRKGRKGLCKEVTIKSNEERILKKKEVLHALHPWAPFAICLGLTNVQCMS